MKETFIKRYIVERTRKVEIRPEEQSEKMKSCQEKLWNEIPLNGLQRQETDRQRDRKRETKTNKQTGRQKKRQTKRFTEKEI